MEILSLGGGVQSGTLLLMNLLGEIEPRADCAFFSDTQFEREATYEYLDWLETFARKYQFKIHRVTAGNIRSDMMSNKDAHDDHIPFFTDSGGKAAGQLRRQCTRHYKTDILRREIRKHLGGKTPYALWIGFSLDEIARVNRNRFPQYVTPRFPLLEKRMRRGDCVAWLESHGFPVPVKSSCVCCPYHRNSEWAAIKRRSPAEFEAACQFDEAIRDRHLHKARRKDFKLYLHSSLQPLRDIQFENPDQLSLFGEQEECEGGCFL